MGSGTQKSTHDRPFSGKLSFVTQDTVVKPNRKPADEASPRDAHPEDAETLASLPRELGGRNGPEPTRFGDWELRGRCIDF